MIPNATPRITSSSSKPNNSPSAAPMPAAIGTPKDRGFTCVASGLPITVRLDRRTVTFHE